MADTILGNMEGLGAPGEIGLESASRPLQQPAAAPPVNLEGLLKGATARQESPLERFGGSLFAGLRQLGALKRGVQNPGIIGRHLAERRIRDEAAKQRMMQAAQMQLQIKRIDQQNEQFNRKLDVTHRAEISKADQEAWQSPDEGKAAYNQLVKAGVITKEEAERRVESARKRRMAYVESAVQTISAATGAKEDDVRKQLEGLGIASIQATLKTAREEASRTRLQRMKDDAAMKRTLAQAMKKTVRDKKIADYRKLYPNLSDRDIVELADGHSRVEFDQSGSRAFVKNNIRKTVREIPIEGSVPPSQAPPEARASAAKKAGRTMVDAINTASTGVVGAFNEKFLGGVIGQIAPDVVPRQVMQDMAIKRQVRQRALSIFKTSGRVLGQEIKNINEFLPSDEVLTSVPADQEKAKALDQHLETVMSEAQKVAADPTQPRGVRSDARRVVNEIRELKRLIGDVSKFAPIESFGSAAGKARERAAKGVSGTTGGEPKDDIEILDIRVK